jgi:endogenous inhibitor of DNA gyrase (YacG/DUF329 family)
MNKISCPVCQREMTGERSAWPQFPFCSPRCKTIDLGRWLGERYRVSQEEDEPEDSIPDDDRELPPAGQSSGRS